MAAKKQEKRSKKRPARKEQRAVLKAPSPAEETGSFFLRKFIIIIAIIIIAMALSGILFKLTADYSEKKALEKKLLGYEEAINNTQIQVTKDTIDEMIASGTIPLPKEEVLTGQQDYICSITTEKGIITLKKRGNLMREEVVRNSLNLSIIFLGDKFYMYHPQYNKWAMFSYDAGRETYNDPYMEMAFSMADLRGINESEYKCVGTSFPDEEFSLGDYEIVDAEEFIGSIGFIG